MLTIIIQSRSSRGQPDDAELKNEPVIRVRQAQIDMAEFSQEVLQCSSYAYFFQLLCCINWLDLYEHDKFHNNYMNTLMEGRRGGGLWKGGVEKEARCKRSPTR